MRLVWIKVVQLPEKSPTKFEENRTMFKNETEDIFSGRQFC